MMLYDECEKVLKPLKDAADKAWRFETPANALSKYLAAIRNSAVTQPLIAPLATVSKELLGNGKPNHALCVAGVGLMLQPDNTELKGIHADADAEVQKNVALFVADATSAAFFFEMEGEEGSPRPPFFPLLGKCLSNMCLPCTALCLWMPLAVAAAGAALFCSDVRAKSADRLCISFAHLGFTHHFHNADPAVAPQLLEIERNRKGEIDFAAVSKGGGNAPVAEFRHSALKVKESPGKGLGLFVAEDIEQGTLLICERAVAAQTPDDRDPRAIEKKFAAVSQLPCSGSLLRPVSKLFAGADIEVERSAADVEEAVLRPLEPIVKAFLFVFDDTDETLQHLGQDERRIAGAIASNAYTCSHYVEQRGPDVALVGLFPSLAMINHDPDPNVAWYFSGQFAFVRTTKCVRGGEEITCTYVGCDKYLQQDEPLVAPWGIPSPQRATPELHALRDLEDQLGAKAHKLAVVAQAAPLLEKVDPPAAKAFVCNAGLFAAMIGDDTHVAYQQLVDMLRKMGSGDVAPDLWVVTHCAWTAERFGKNNRSLAAIKDLVKAPARVIFGHDNVKAVSRNGGKA